MGLPYEVHLIDIGAGDQFAPDFLKIAPNNRMPAIVDHDGPGGAPVSIFESGAILQYLARKTGRFYGETERERIAVEEWLMWQMGGVGPMAGQAHHFIKYAPAMDPPNDLPYPKDRYRNEVGRLYGVLDRRLADRDYVAGPLSIADFAIWPWASLWEGQEQTLGRQAEPCGLAGAHGCARGRPEAGGRSRLRSAANIQAGQGRSGCACLANGSSGRGASPRRGAGSVAPDRTSLRSGSLPARPACARSLYGRTESQKVTVASDTIVSSSTAADVTSMARPYIAEKI